MSNIFDMVDGDARLTSGRRKVIITCAVTGSVHTPSMSEYLPVTPVQIAEQAIEAARAGAAILHLHARNHDGSPTPDPTVFERICPPHRRRDRRDHQHHDQRRRPGNAGGAPRLSAQGQAGAVLPQHGLDELRLPQGGPRRRRTGSTPGREPTSRAPKTASSSNTFGDIRTILGAARRPARRAFRVRVLRRRPICTISPIASTRVSSRGRCSFSASSAFSAAWGQIRRICS